MGNAWKTRIRCSTAPREWREGAKVAAAVATASATAAAASRAIEGRGTKPN